MSTLGEFEALCQAGGIERECQEAKRSEKYQRILFCVLNFLPWVEKILALFIQQFK